MVLIYQTEAIVSQMIMKHVFLTKEIFVIHLVVILSHGAISIIAQILVSLSIVKVVLIKQLNIVLILTDFTAHSNNIPLQKEATVGHRMDIHAQRMPQQIALIRMDQLVVILLAASVLHKIK